jgi:hypothetical protein
MVYAEPEPVKEKDLDRLNGDLSEKDRMGRQEAAIAMRISGATYTEVAEVLGYASASHARRAVEAGLASTVGEEDRAQQRFIASRRLERILRGLWKKSTDETSEEHIPAARTALAIIDRHIKLNGLDAPSEHVIYNPGMREIEEWVRGMTEKIVGATPDERDIITAEYTEVYDNDEPQPGDEE